MCFGKVTSYRLLTTIALHMHHSIVHFNPFRDQCSMLGVSGVISQGNGIKTVHIITFWSGKFKIADRMENEHPKLVLSSTTWLKWIICGKTSCLVLDYWTHDVDDAKENLATHALQNFWCNCMSICIKFYAMPF